MNWYKLEKFADSERLKAYLQSLSVNNDIIDYLLSLPEDQNRSLLVNQVRQNPQISLVELQGFAGSQESRVDPYNDYEKQIASMMASENRFDRSMIHADFEKWILVNFRKLREQERQQLVEDINYVTFRDKLQEISDWYFRTNIQNIAQYTPEQAIAASDAWHAAAAGKGAGLVYEPTNPELVLYGPKWQNEEWNGWTIQLVRSKNDLAAEGNKMNNCVGDYCQDVEYGDVHIVSLRDPQNNPHVTIDLSPDGSTTRQIKGNSNNEPGDNYKEMIKEWVSSGTGPTYDEDLHEYDIHMQLDYDVHEDNTVSDVLDGYGKKQNEYGLLIDNPDKEFDIPSILDSVIGSFNIQFKPSSRTPMDIDHGQVEDGVLSLINLVIKEHGAQALKDLESAASDIENTFIEEFTENISSYRMPPYPDEDTYENPQDYAAAEKEYDDTEKKYLSEAQNESVEGTVSNSILRTIARLRKTDDIPSYEETTKVAQNWYTRNHELV